MVIQKKIVGINKGEFTSNDELIKFTHLLVRDLDTGKVSKMKASTDFDFEPYVDKDVELTVIETVNKELVPTQRVMSAEEL